MAERQRGRVLRADHIGYVVNDLPAAVAFFIDVLGFADIDRRGTLAVAEGDELTRLLGVHPRAEASFAFVRAGDDTVELMSWTAPDHRPEAAKNSDASGRHLALRVDDLDALIARVREVPGAVVRERSPRGFVYVTTPFGLELQLIQN
ncbi:MAG: VOC family protein [Thermomicrobiales bacterium]